MKSTQQLCTATVGHEISDHPPEPNSRIPVAKIAMLERRSSSRKRSAPVQDPEEEAAIKRLRAPHALEGRFRIVA